MKTVEKLARARKRLEFCRQRREDHIRSLVRYQTLIPTWVRMIERLERRHEREMIRQANAAAPAPTEAAPVVEAVAALIADDGDELKIPPFLQRTPPAAVDPGTEKLKLELAEAAKQKAKLAKERAAVRAEKKQAMLTGQTRRMPLSGKAALEAIRG